MPLMPLFIIILSLMIILSSCRSQVYHPKTHENAARLLPSGITADTYQGLPELDLALTIIDHQTFRLTDLYIDQDLVRINNLIIIPANDKFEDLLNHPQNLNAVSFKATTDVYCVMGQCQGVKMSGFADVDINLETRAIKVTNLHATNQSKSMILSGSIERILPHELLINLAKTDLVLTIDDTNMIMNSKAQLLFYQHLARDGVLDGIFRINNEDFGIILDGNLSSP